MSNLQAGLIGVRSSSASRKLAAHAGNSGGSCNDRDDGGMSPTGRRAEDLRATGSPRRRKVPCATAVAIQGSLPFNTWTAHGMASRATRERSSRSTWDVSISLVVDVCLGVLCMLPDLGLSWLWSIAAP